MTQQTIDIKPQSLQPQIAPSAELQYGRILSGHRSIRDGVWSASIGTEYLATYTFRNDSNNMATHWEWLCKDDWSVFMDLEGTKVK